MKNTNKFLNAAVVAVITLFVYVDLSAMEATPQKQQARTRQRDRQLEQIEKQQLLQPETHWDKTDLDLVDLDDLILRPINEKDFRKIIERQQQLEELQQIEQLEQQPLQPQFIQHQVSQLQEQHQKKPWGQPKKNKVLVDELETLQSLQQLQQRRSLSSQQLQELQKLQQEFQQLKPQKFQQVQQQFQQKQLKTLELEKLEKQQLNQLEQQQDLWRSPSLLQKQQQQQSQNETLQNKK